MAAKSKPAWRFQYVGLEPAPLGLEPIVRKKGNPDEPEMIYPGDEVVVDDPRTADWLRGLTNFGEVRSPTAAKPTHRKRTPAKPKPKPKPKGSAGAG